ncbi:MAG: peptidase S9 [Deltaproteobacteria bacterium]|nr:peptidase S9 [Deltaproteobacteria bacterium]
MKRLAVFFCLLFSFHPLYSHAANLDPSFSFSTIETAHFSIHFHQGLEEVAQKAAGLSEEVYGPLVKEFGWEPLEKTQVVLIDDTDFTNGFATVLPYNRIFVQVVPPSLDMSIGEYEDWLRMLIVHEYTHILTMDPARGYSEVTRAIFGKPIPGYNPFSFLMFIATAPPNVFLPAWWHEGMATWGESEYGVGRGQSAFYDMILRMAVADNNIPSVDQANGEVPYWPDGRMPYIFGLRLQKYIADRYGKEALGRLSTTHAGRFPYFINEPTLRQFGKEYADLYRDMVSDLRGEEEKRIEVLKNIPFTPVKRFDIEGELLTNPRFSPDGQLIAFNSRDPHRHEALMIAGKDGSGAREVVRRLPSDRSISWSNDGSKLFFCQAEINRGFDIYQDLYSYDLKSLEQKRLTRGLRIKEPDLSPDGKRFAVIVSERGSQNLALLESEGGRYTLNPFTDYRLIHLSSPRWSPDGRYIAYSVKDNSGRSGIHLYDIMEKRDTILFGNGYDNAYPVWSPDGRYVIYTSDETGVFNLFAYSVVDGKRYQITHLLGGAFQPDISSGEMVFSSYGSRGFKIVGMEYAPEKWMTEPGPAIKPYWKNEPKYRDSSASPQNDNSSLRNPHSEINSASGPYSALPTLLPRFWLPTLSGDHEGTVAGAFTAGQDVLGYNTYLAQVDYGTSSGRTYYDAMYLNDYFYPTFMLQSYTRPVLYSDLLSEGDYFELNRSLILSMMVPVNYLESGYRFATGYHMQRQEELSTPDNGTRFNLFEGKRNNLFASVEFSNALKYPYSISHEEGRTISLTHRYYSNETGSDLDSKEYIASYTEYLLIPSDYLKHHVVYLNLKGATSDGDRAIQQSFQLGGYPPQSEFPLRGYPSRFETGKYIATGTLEYRAPIKYIFSGPGTKPFFWDRLHGAIFTDVGEVWDDETGFTSDKLKVGAGAEARLDMTLGYWLRITPTFGVAHGFNEGGETTVYFTIYTNL